MRELLSGDIVVAVHNGTDYREDIAQVGTHREDTGARYTRHDYKRGDEGLVVTVSFTGSLDIEFDNGLTMMGCSPGNFARVDSHNGNTGECSKEAKKWGERCS
jgi:hypothetical protein